jgi:putative ABC transport system permease protein
MTFPTDFHRAWRSLWRSPGFVAAAVLSLGLATGAGVAGFGVLDAVRFRALPFPDAHRLVLIGEAPEAGCPGFCDVNYRTFDLLRTHRFTSIDAVAGFTGGGKALGEGADQVDVVSTIISASAFQLLGARPLLGRTFAPDEDQLGAAPLMVIGHGLWSTVFGGDSSIIGRTFRLSDEPFTVIGVMPPGFEFESRSDVWLAATRYLDPRTGTSLRSINVLARLTPGATMPQLEAELRGLEDEANTGRAVTARTKFTVAPLRSRYVEATRSHDVIFAAIVGAILIIGSANVAGLVLVRAMRQRRALAVRAALGARRPVLVRYLVAENAILCGLGLAVGLLLARFALGALGSVAPLLTPMRVAGMEYRMDWRAVAFAVLLGAVATALLSIAPIRLILRADLQPVLREGALSATGSRGTQRIQQAFVVVQTACAVALLIATGLLAKTVSRFTRVDLGYDAARVAIVSAVPAHSGRLAERYLPAADRILADIAAIPGVEGVAVRMPVPLGAARARPPGAIVVRREVDASGILLDGARPLEASLQPRTAYGVSADYFRVMGIPLAAGRAFDATDREGTPAVAVINAWAANHWWPGESAVGKVFAVDTAPGARATITVVGVVKDNLAAQPSILLARSGPEVYRPYRQAHFWLANYYVRLRGSPAPILDQAQRAVMRVVPANGRARGNLLASQVRAQLQTVRTNAMQIAGFASVGLLLAMTGLYGVLSYLVQQRTREIGIRGVLGAGRRQILSLVLSQAVGVTLVGIVLGFLTAVFGMRLAAGLLYGTPPNDPVVYAAVAAMSLIIALAASTLPALRAARVDPTVALRTE